MYEKNNKRHKHSKLIRNWTGEAKIQRFDGTRWRNEKHPSWDANEEDRVHDSELYYGEIYELVVKVVACVVIVLIWFSPIVLLILYAAGFFSV